MGKEMKRVSDRIYRIDRMAGRWCLKFAKMTKVPAIEGQGCAAGAEDFMQVFCWMGCS
jgi:hypothetical protein